MFSCCFLTLHHTLISSQLLNLICVVWSENCRLPYNSVWFFISSKIVGGNGMGKNNGVSSKTHTQQQRNYYANQKNKNNAAYRARLDNHSNQKNPNLRESKINLSKSDFQIAMWPGFIDN